MQAMVKPIDEHKNNVKHLKPPASLRREQQQTAYLGKGVLVLCLRIECLPFIAYREN